MAESFSALQIETSFVFFARKLEKSKAMVGLPPPNNPSVAQAAAAAADADADAVARVGGGAGGVPLAAGAPSPLL